LIARRRVVLVSGVCASALALAVPIVFGGLWPGYSHVRHYISMLGERGAPHAAWVNCVGFVPTGIATLIFTVAVGPRLPAARANLPGRMCFALVGVAYIAAAVFPCDPGCPATGSITQCVHSLFGVGEYVGASVGLAILAATFRRDRRWRRMAALTTLSAVGTAAGFGMMVTPTLAPWRGLTQRIAEGSIFLWIATAAFRAGRRR
jgi:hypothetical membrane protein